VLFIVGLYVIMGIGLNIAVGFAGLLVLGYAAFYGISAYTYVLLIRWLSPNPAQSYTHLFWLLLPVCVAVSMGVGFLLGIPVLRTRGDYLAIVTLGFGEIVRILLNNMDSITNGPQGLTGKSPLLFGFRFKDPIHFYYIILVGCALAIFVADRLNNSRIGRAWIAMRDDEDVAQMMGINVVCGRVRRDFRRTARHDFSGGFYDHGLDERLVPHRDRRHGQHPGRRVRLDHSDGLARSVARRPTISVIGIRVFADYHDALPPRRIYSVGTPQTRIPKRRG